MQTYSNLTLEIDARGVAYVTLNRPELHNAFDAALIGELTHVFDVLDNDAEVRLAVLSGHGKSFCAGGDLHWMRAMKNFTQAENIEDAMHLARMYGRIRAFKSPLIGVVHGFALGGGSGLASVCDYVVASEDAKFGFTEVRLGLIPATISPFVMEKIGAANARAYFLSGSQFSAYVAKDIGLVQRLAAPTTLMAAKEEVVAEFLKAGPEAARKAKQLINDVTRLSSHPLELTEHTAHAIAFIRTSAEGQEGMDALIAGRKPHWVTPS